MDATARVRSWVLALVLLSLVSTLLSAWGGSTGYTSSMTLIAVVAALLSRSLAIAVIALLHNAAISIYSLASSISKPGTSQAGTLQGGIEALWRGFASDIPLLLALVASGAVFIARLVSLIRSRPYIDVAARNLLQAIKPSLLKYGLCMARRNAAIILITSSLLAFPVEEMVNPVNYIGQSLYQALLLSSAVLAVPVSLVSSLDTLTAGLLLPVLVAALALPQPLLLVAMISVLPVEALPTTLRLAERTGYRLGVLEAVMVYAPTIRYTITQTQPITGAWWAPSYPRVDYRLATATTRENPHVLITGTTGAGKSSTAIRLARSILEEAKSPILLVIDPHGEYSTMLGGVPGVRIVDASKEAPNPLDFTGQSPRERALELVELIAELYQLGPIQSRILEEAILLAYENAGIREDDPSTWNRKLPTITDVVKILEGMAKKEPRAGIVAMYLSSLATAFGGSVPFPLPGSRTAAIVFDLSRLATREQMILYTDTLLYKLYYMVKRLGPSDKLRYILLIDEAHLFARKTRKRNIVALIAAELRKYGVMLVLVTQRASEIDKTVAANMGTVICLRHTDPAEAKFAAEAISKNSADDSPEALAYTIARLPKGYVVVGDVGLDAPLLVNIAR